jgi:hypothetical protein
VSELRRFTRDGIAEFERRLEAIKAGERGDIDDHLTLNREWTEMVQPTIEIERPAFQTKRDAGSYLSQILKPVRGPGAAVDPGMWTWLSAWFFDSLCPMDASGARSIKASPHYVMSLSDGRGRSEHLLFTSTVVFELAPETKIILEGPISSLTREGHEIGGRLSLLRIREMPALLDRLYWDNATNRVKQGASSPDYPGNFRSRLHRRVDRLTRTYDLTDLPADRLLQLLGDEFKAWDGGTPPRLPKADKAAGV